MSDKFISPFMVEPTSEIPFENDPDYNLITIDYSRKSWEEFDRDLSNPNSPIRKTLDNIK